MGFLQRLLGAANRVDDARQTAEDAVFRDRRFDRAEDLARSGGTVEGVVTGVHFRFTNDSTEGFYRVEWSDPAPRVAGVRFAGPAPAAVRYGAAVPLRIAGEKAVVDAAALTGHTGVPTETGLSLRSAPDPGISDSALNADVLKGLRTWPREPATVVASEPSTFMGMSSQNWHVSVRLADGVAATVRKAYVPPYVRFFIHPGAVVSVAVDPGDRTRVFVDWVAVARDNAGGSWRDAPPPGSLAGSGAAPAAAPEQFAAMGQPVDLTPAPGGLEAIEGVSLDQVAVVENWLIRDRVPPGEYDAYATARFQVAPGRYRAVKAAWDARMRGDWRLAAAYNEEYERVRKALKKQR